MLTNDVYLKLHDRCSVVFSSFVLRHSFDICHLCFVIVAGFHGTDAVRVTVTDTRLASSRGNFRSSTVIFWMRKVFSNCVANPSPSLSITLSECSHTHCFVLSATLE